MLRGILSSLTSLAVQYFSSYLLNNTVFEIKVDEHKMHV